MKKLFYIGALSAFLLAACGEEEATLKRKNLLQKKSNRMRKQITMFPNTKSKKMISVKECGK
ncbi:hypothetical protein M5J14_08195 [Lysinibacillus sp. OL1_EC]|uniref:hypothetical protein n=1 Tax=unclassified Lysinibacillus TaxID=2636778 RepID=UPI00103CF1CE|nr:MULTISPECIES: hypothetical protein [unclassified Lysinibacillus]MCM0624506.1 hypothetical protein [Lysinibacillus sp. OL1_EC]TBV88227.1 hypothetical protein EW028_07245 [Lysinibacillus sp. OL1]